MNVACATLSTVEAYMWFRLMFNRSYVLLTVARRFPVASCRQV